MTHDYEFRPYRIRLYKAQEATPVEALRDRAYFLDLDLNPGPGLDVSARRLAEAFKRLLRIAGITRDEEYYQLKVTDHPGDDNPIWWVPNRPDDEEDLRWRR